MRDMSADRVIAGAAGVAREPIVIDGKVLNGSPQEIFVAGRQSNVPVMLGFTRDEAFRSLGPVKTVADYHAAIGKTLPANADAVLKAHPAKSDASVARAVADVQRDASVGKQMAVWARAQRQFGKAPVHAWHFTRWQPYAPGIVFSNHDPATVGAYHTGEVPYYFQTLDSLNLFSTTRNWGADDRAMAETMSNMLISFAKTGLPAANWPAFDPRRARVMQLDLQPAVLDWPNYKALDLLNAVPAPRPAANGRVRD
jgi:para-nitrobenzyl esterase